MCLVMIFTAATFAFAEGVILTSLVATRGRIGGIAVLALVIGVCLLWFCRYSNRRLTAFERERLHWRKGAVGEWEVEAELQRLSEKFFVFHNLNTGRGNFDLIIVGPTGLFVLETKNWIGLVAADAAGELTLNGQELEQPYVKKFVRRIMLLREQISAPLQSNDLFIRGVMVFPKAHVDAPYGTTQQAHCVRLEQLHDYVEHPVYSRKLSQDEINRLVRVLRGIAGTDKGFPHTETVGLRGALTSLF
jgi:hypothetical protein